MKNSIFQADKCPLTGVEKPHLKVIEHGISQTFDKNVYQWIYPEDEQIVMVVESELFRDQAYWDSNQTAIFYLIENGIWPKGKMVDRPLLEILISSSGIPVTPIEKIDEILYYLNKNAGHLGQYFLVREDWDYDLKFMKKIGVSRPEELTNLINEALANGWIKEEDGTSADISIGLTLNGWERASRILKSSESKIVFVAMSFDPEMIQVYNDWIEPAIRESGFEPYIVLDQHPESDVTINDAILAGIKKAKFTIADFTHHKSGVYFEAGYALGRGQKVIYTCQEDHIGTAHFDTRNYQHLVWKDGADLKKKLMDKIEVFIKA